MLAGCGSGAPDKPVSPPVVVTPPAPPPMLPPPEYRAFGAAQPVTITGYDGDAMESFLFKDGTTLFFNNRNDPAIDTNLFYATRIDDLSYRFEGEVAGANGPKLDAVASLDANGRFVFVSTRSYETSRSTLYIADYSAGRVSEPVLIDGVSLMQPGMVNFDAEISADGRSLWFDDGRFDGGSVPATASIVVAERAASGFVRLTGSGAMLAQVNASGLNYAPCISADGLELFFTRIDPSLPVATPAIFRSVRTSVNAAFGSPQRVVAAAGFVEAPTLSADGRLLIFHRLDGGRYSLFHILR